MFTARKGGQPSPECPLVYDRAVDGGAVVRLNWTNVERETKQRRAGLRNPSSAETDQIDGSRAPACWLAGSPPRCHSTVPCLAAQRAAPGARSALEETDRLALGRDDDTHEQLTPDDVARQRAAGSPRRARDPAGGGARPAALGQPPLGQPGLGLPGKLLQSQQQPQQQHVGGWVVAIATHISHIGSSTEATDRLTGALLAGSRFLAHSPISLRRGV